MLPTLQPGYKSDLYLPLQPSLTGSSVPEAFSATHRPVNGFIIIRFGKRRTLKMCRAGEIATYHHHPNCLYEPLQINVEVIKMDIHDIILMMFGFSFRFFQSEKSATEASTMLRSNPLN